MQNNKTAPFISAPFRRAMFRLGVDRLARRFYGGMGVILMLHRLRDEADDAWRGDPALYVTPSLLSAAIDMLRAEGYDIVTLDEALARMHTPTGRRFACLTFDDGYRDNHDLLLPVLRRHDAPATVYLTSGFIDGTAQAWWHVVEAVLRGSDALTLELDGARHEWPARDLAERQAAYDGAVALLRHAGREGRAQCVEALGTAHGVDPRAITAGEFMTWDLARELADSGLATLGAHTETHAALRGLDVAEARREIDHGRQRIEEEIGRPVMHFAYPYGTRETVDDQAIAVAATSGLTSATIAGGGPVTRRSPRHALPRIYFGVSDGLDGLRMRLTGLGPALARLNDRDWPPTESPIA